MAQVSPSPPPTPTLTNIGGIVEDQPDLENLGTSSRHVWFPKANIIPVSLSEPRDVLQSERTFLGFIRFALSLFFTAIGLILGFQLRSNGSGGLSPDSSLSTFNRVNSNIMIVLAFLTLLVAGANYFRTVRRYSQKRIQTNGTNNLLVVVCVSAVVVTLAGLNVSLIVERYRRDS